MIASQLVLPTRGTNSPPITPPIASLCHHGASYGPPTHASEERPFRWADYPRLVYLQTRAFDQLLDESVDCKQLALKMEEMEVASNDLITLKVTGDGFITWTRVSNLGSNDHAAEMLGRLVNHAGETGRSLRSLGERTQKALYSYVSRPATTCTDFSEPNHYTSITSLNDWASQTIEASETLPLVARMLPFLLSNDGPAEEAVLRTFILLMDNFGCHIVDLREEAETSLNHLEELLIALRELTHRDNKGAFADLWTLLEENQRRLGKTNLILDLPKDMKKWRREALTHVVTTMRVLSALEEDMEKLRARVATLDTVGDKIPISVHTKSIRAGTDRLKEGQVRAGLRRGSRRKLGVWVIICTESGECSFSDQEMWWTIISDFLADYSSLYEQYFSK
jgi:hypothetical protein